MHSDFKNGSRLSGIVENIPISDIVSPFNNLRNSDNLNIEKITMSIRQHGLIHPITVRPKENEFEIVAGYRRYLACKKLRWKKIPCHVVFLDETQSFELALVENIRRKAFTPLEEAAAFKAYVVDHGWGGITKLSKKLGRSPSAIVRRIGLLDLPDEALEEIKNSALSPSTAEELIPLKDPERQSELAKLISRRHLTVKNLRCIIKEESSVSKESLEIESRSKTQSLDKSIGVLKIAMSKLISILEEETEKNNDFAIQELLLDQKNKIHNQIDLLLIARKKYLKYYCGTGKST
ncbi:MAG: ParB/RepB/Spo0J family partition protein [Candidatus Nitrosocosmicus sp.]|jgi:ParB family chromosome partitioning protein|nr:ParB/RepB/Spo0J family partition protein [Candidatus Nitrosocosmicus sp.]